MKTEKINSIEIALQQPAKETAQEIIENNFLYQKDNEFTAFIDNLPAAYWSRYDISATRIGWEAHKIFASKRLQAIDNILRKMPEKGYE